MWYVYMFSTTNHVVHSDHGLDSFRGSHRSDQVHCNQYLQGGGSTDIDNAIIDCVHVYCFL